MPKGIALGSGFLHKAPSIAAGAATKAIKAAALSQIPRLNSIVLLKARVRTKEAAPAGLENLLARRVPAFRIVQIGAE